jgi:NDP-sugar pyrophosphorylase family protein
MLLCAGQGTRLNGLADELPKPLCPVCDVAIVRYGIALLVGHGIRDIVINLHHRPELFEAELGDGSALGARIRYSHEPVLLGTGGGLKRALPLLDPDGTDEPFVSMNGKLVFDLDLGALLAAHRADPDALGTLVVRRLADPAAFSAVDAAVEDGRLRIRDILGAGQYMFCGVHITRPSVIRRLPDGECCSVRQGYLPWMRQGGRVAGFEVGDVYFAEHSTPRRYLESNFDLLAGAPLRHPPAAPLVGVAPDARVADSAELRGPVRVGPGARIGAGAVVGPLAVVGSSAEVAAGAVVTRAVVWPGARAEGAVCDCIIARRGVVRAD